MINKKILNVLLVFSFFGLMMIISNSSAKADTWPQNGWGNDGNNVNASIDLFKNANHNSDKSYVKVNFRAYASGNTSSSNIAVNIVKDPDGAHTDCDLSGAATLWMYSYTNDGENKDVDWNSIQTFADCPQFGSSKSITLSGGVYNAGLNKTVYNVGVAIVSASNGNRFRFDAQADGIEFGFGESGQLYFSIDGAGGNDAYKDIAIPVCVNADGEKSFSTYDPDNPDGTVQKNPYDFALKSNGVRKKAASTWASSGASGEWKYNNPENRRYSPRYGTGVTAGINYTMQKDKKYVFRMNNLGVNNYVSLKMPGREVCSGSVTKADWTIKSDSSVSPAVIYKGESTTFSHKAYNEGPLSTDKDVDVDMIRKWDGTGDWTGLNLYQPVAKDGSKSIADPQTFSTVGTYEEYVRYNPESDDDEDSNFTNGSTATAYVVAPTPGLEVPPGYEKGTGGTIDIKHKISISPCPPAGFTRTVSWKISGKEGNGVDYSETKDSTLGNGVCEDSVTKQLNGSWLDSNNVGPAVTYKTDAPTGFGSTTNTLSVYEVPFARFYGNDIYATGGDAKGEIRFNDSDNADGAGTYDGRGSASQYAALAFGAVKIDTAAYRHPDYYASFNANAAITSTLPPNGLDAANSKFGARSATDEYNKVVANIPNNCTAFPGNLNVATGCYTATGETTINATNYSNKVTLKAETVVIKGNNVVVPPPPPPAPDPPAPQPDPKPRDDGLNVVTISTIDSNRRSYERTFDVGSYYSVDKLFGSTGVRCGEYIFSPCIRDITFRKPGYKVTFVGSRFLGGEVTVTNNFNYRSITGDRTFLSWQAANQRYIQYFKVESTAPAAVTNRVSPMAPTPAAEAAFVGDPPEAGPLDGADPNLPTGIALIVADNIYIDKSVERIDAILVAKNAIYTCTEGAAQIPNADLENTNKCRKTLTVNGAISAPTIKFQRVGGSRYLNNPRSADDKETCHISHGIQNCDARGDIANDSGKTAEVINFPAYLYFTSPYLKNNTDPGTPRLDNMFTAPPRQ